MRENYSKLLHSFDKCIKSYIPSFVLSLLGNCSFLLNVLYKGQFEEVLEKKDMCFKKFSPSADSVSSRAPWD